MWRSLSRKYRKEAARAWPLSIYNQKGEWLKKHLPNVYPVNRCIFCEMNYALGGTIPSPGREGCSKCPGKAVDPNFNCQYPEETRWSLHPDRFYNYLVRLNRKRLKEARQQCSSDNR